MSAVTLRAYRPGDSDVVRRWIDDPAITGGSPTAAPLHDDDAEGVLRRSFDGEGDLGDLVMRAMTRDEWEEARKVWNSTG
jgi:hypothetical protein